MADAIGQVLSLGVGVSLSPVPIIAVVLMLATPRARSNGPAFVLGWIAGLVLVGSVVLVVAGGADAGEGSDPATWVDVLKLALGALLLLIAVRQWVKRPRDGADARLPGWMRTIHEFSPVRSVALGFALSAVNPKNLLLTVAAAAAVAGAGSSAGQEAVAFGVFVAVATLGPGAPVVIYFALGERAERMLDGLKTWLSVHNAAVMAVLCLILGAKLIGDGIAGLG